MAVVADLATTLALYDEVVMARKIKSVDSAWNASQIERRRVVELGGTVVANLRTDAALIAWATDRDLFTRIDRRSEWGNPYVLDEDGDRETVIDSYRLHLARKPSLLKRLGDLSGKVLGCWCYPEPCHGCVLVDLIAERSDGQHAACGGLHRPRANCA